MRTLVRLLAALFSVILFLLIVAYFLPREVQLERSIGIHAPARVVFNQVNDLYSWDKWSVWNQLDPGMEITYQNGGIGEKAAYSWKSSHPKVGDGKLTITGSSPYDSIRLALEFGEESPSESWFRFSEEDEQTTVVWGFGADMGMNPLARWMGLFINRMVGPDFEKGLQNLKTVSEIIVQEGRPIVELVTLPAFNYVSLRKTVTSDEVSDEMGAMYGKLTQYINNHQLLMTDMPYAIYHKIDNGVIDLEAGIPVDRFTEPEGEVLAGNWEAGNYAQADHIGSYETLGETHEFIQQWITGHHFTISGGPMEKYLTDPQSEPNPKKWITAIYYPIN
ncbi:MAG: GyrI-like domain-containing protein [Mangrovibacterium sp.]